LTFLLPIVQSKALGLLQVCAIKSSRFIASFQGKILLSMCIVQP